MTTQAKKTKTCTRCHGKGIGSWRAHQGICYKCNGSGILRWYSKEELIADAETQRDKKLAEIEAQAARAKARMAADPTDYCDDAELLTRLRKQWLNVANTDTNITRGSWG